MVEEEEKEEGGGGGENELRLLYSSVLLGLGPIWFPEFQSWVLFGKGVVRRLLASEAAVGFLFDPPIGARNSNSTVFSLYLLFVCGLSLLRSGFLWRSHVIFLSYIREVPSINFCHISWWGAIQQLGSK